MSTDDGGRAAWWDEAFVCLFVFAGLAALGAIAFGRFPVAVVLLALVGFATVALTVLRARQGGSLRDFFRGQSTRGACSTCHHTDAPVPGCRCSAGWCPCHRGAYGHGGWGLQRLVRPPERGRRRSTVTDDKTQELLAALLDRVREFTASLTEEQVDALLSGRAGLALVDVEPTERESA